MYIKIQLDNGYTEFGADRQLTDYEELELIEEIRDLVRDVLIKKDISYWSEIGD